MSLLEDIARGEPYDLEFKLIPNEDRIKYLTHLSHFASKNIIFHVGDLG